MNFNYLLNAACQEGNVAALQLWFPDGPTQWRSPGGSSLLHMAAHTPHLPVLDWLLTFPFDVNESTQYGATPLMWACHGCQPIMARRLLAHGAALQATDLKGWTALHWACAHEWVDGVTWLLEQGADPDAQNDQEHRPEEVVSGFSPHYAVLCTRLEAARHGCGLK
jgi:ankyrin repeat protein